jgi:hypothetical protein
MSVVAGVALLDGVVIVSDTRVTWPDGSRSDNLEKILAFVPGAAIAFVGDVEFASDMLRECASQASMRQRLDPTSLSLWLPRFFQWRYRELVSKFRRSPYVGFMVGLCIGGRPNVLRKSEIMGAATQRGQRDDGIGLNSILWRLINAKAEAVSIPGTSASILQVLGAPDFKAKSFPPLCPITLGTGRPRSEGQIYDLHDLIHFWDPYRRQTTPAPTGYEVFWLRQALSASLAEPTVGGLFPAVLVRSGSVMPLWQKSQTGNGQPLLSLTYEIDRWVQRNHMTGQEVILLKPWEIGTNPRNLLFDHRLPSGTT